MCLSWASGGAILEMGRWRVRWEWGGAGVREDDEVSPEKVNFEVPAGHPSRDPEAHVFS